MRIEISFIIAALIVGCLGLFQPLILPMTPIIRTIIQLIWVVCSLSVLAAVILVEGRSRNIFHHGRTRSPTADATTEIQGSDNSVGTGLVILLGPFTLLVLGLVGISTKIWPVKDEQPSILMKDRGEEERK